MSIVANGTSTATATATVTGGRRLPPQNITITSSDPGETISSVTDDGDGTYTATVTSSTTPGRATITATDTSIPNLTSTATLTQTAPPTNVTPNISLTLTPPSIVANGISASIATATVTDETGAPVPGEKIRITSSDPGERTSTVTDHGDGTYTATVTSSTSPGRATITATDTSTPNVTATALLTQVPTPQVPTASGTTTSLLAAPSAAVTNQPVTVRATVTSTSDSPSGTLTFENRGAAVAGCVSEKITPSNRAAACTTSFAASTSPERLIAVFTPEPGSSVAGSSSGVATVTVAPDSTSTSLDVSNPVNVGKSTTYTATVAPPAGRPGPIKPSGSVEFFDGGRPIASCVGQPLIGGGATCTVTYKSAGTHSITARYGGDANFTSSGSSPRAVKAVPARALGTITSTMQWTFYYTPTYTKVLALVVNGASPGATIFVHCGGKGCPFVMRATRVKMRPCGRRKGKRKCPTQRTVDLTPPLRNHRLHVGARINVELVRPGWIGKYYMFTVRSGRGPRVQISCLAPSGTRPGVGC